MSLFGSSDNVCTQITKTNVRTKIWKAKFGMGHIQLLIMCLPAIIFVALFNYFPMFGLLIAFKDYKYDMGIFGSQWVGFENFKFFFTSQDILVITRNTILLNLGLIIVSTAVSVILALLLYEITNKTLIKTYQTILFIPYFTSWVVVSYISYAFLHESYGIINKFLESVGLQSMSWYNMPNLWPIILILAGTWKNIGYYTVIYYSAMMAIDHEYFEAAAIDGAGKLKATLNISLPFLSPVVFVLTLLAVGRILYSDFGLFWFLPMQSGSLIPTTDVIDTYTFRSLRIIGDIGMSSAVNFYQSFMGLAVILFSNYAVRKINKESALF